MIINQIKVKFFDILTNDLKYHVIDHPQKEKNKQFPCVFLKIQKVSRDFFKNNFRIQVNIKIDIFSNYDGEKEILEMEEAIFAAAQALYDVVGVTYVRQSDFRILDDKSTAVVRKHGIISYSIISAGKVEEDQEDDENNSTNP